MIIKDRDYLNEDGTVPGKLLLKCIQEHQKEVNERYAKLFSYYKGDQDILYRTFEDTSMPNNKVVCNHASYITDIANGYVLGEPIQYTGDGIEALLEQYADIDEDSHNAEIGLDASIFGHGLEILYMSNDDKPAVMLACVSPINSFLVCDSTVDNVPMFGCTYTAKYDLDETLQGYDVTVLTKDKKYKYTCKDMNSEDFTLVVDPEEHYFGDVPMIEYKNNKFAIGDFEPVITLIDAYNKLQSDRVNDKEQLIDALLAVTGMTFGDDEDEMTRTAKFLKKMRILEIPEGGKAEWLTKSLNETEVEVLKDSLKEDIHEFSKVPCLSDKDFIGNSSGVAIKYKLIAFENMAKQKERYFKKGLRKRLQMTSNVESVRGGGFDVSSIDIVMKRTLPIDEETLAKIANETSELLSLETRIKRFDEEIDVSEELKRISEERQEAAKEARESMMSEDYNNFSDNDKKNEKSSKND